MKSPILAAFAAAVLAGPAGADQFKEKARQIQALYQQGTLAMNSGETETARSAFQEILRIQPGHGHAKFQLSRLKSHAGKLTLQKRKALFQKTILKSVDFEDTTLEEALEILALQTSEVSQKAFEPNFIIQDSSGQLAAKKISLRLNRIPLAAALKYTLEQAGAQARYDQYATIISPLARVRP